MCYEPGMRRAVLILILAACGGTSPAQREPAPQPASDPDPDPDPDPVPDPDPDPDPVPDPAPDPKPVAGRGTIRGTVTDLAGKPLGGVAVIIDRADGGIFSDTTDAAGVYSLPDLPTGPHEVTFSYRKMDFRKTVEVEAASETVLSVTINPDPHAPTVVH
jgi:hypothetical protein